MSIFIARYKKNDNYLAWGNEGQLFDNNIPFSPKNRSLHRLKKCELFVAHYDVALEREEHISEDRVTLVQGYGLEDLEEKFENSIKEGKALDYNTFHEAFCAVSISDDSLHFATSASGVDALFYLETPNEFVVTNKSNLLQPYIEKEKLPFRKEAFAWMLGRGHLSDNGTYWQGIEKSLLGSLYSYSNENLTQNSIKLYQGSVVEADEIKSAIEDVTSYFDTLIDSLEKQKRIWLSGGKDSRAITGLFKNSSSFDSFDFVTHGDAFSPDVMGARDVAKRLNVQEKHTVNAPSLTQNNINIFSRIAEDLSWCSSGSSLADLKSFKQNELLVIGGHENGFKTKPNTLGLESFLESRRYWVDSKGILSKEMFEKQFKNYKMLLQEILENVPTSKYLQMESLYFRNGTYIASALSASHIGTSEIHPFLDGKMIYLLLHAKDEVLESQLIHYLMMHQANLNLESLPFADDRWPNKLKEVLKSIELEFEKEPEPPYEFKKYYPTEKGIGLYKWRLELVRISQAFMLSYLKEHTFFDFIDYEKLVSLAQNDIESLKLGDIYFWLGMLKACMVYEFGLNALDFTKREEIAKKIEALFKKHTSEELISSSDFSGTTSKEDLKKMQQKLADYEKCITTMIQVSREGEDKSDTREQKDSDNIKKYLHECQNSASFKLGHLLIHETKSLSDILKLPKKILAIKRGA